MKRISGLFIVLIISVCASAQIDKVIPPRPTVPKLVNDYANILTTEQEHALETKLVAYDDSTSSQIAIVTLPTLKDTTTGDEYEDEEVALKILREWGVGQKDRNNGVVILIVKNQDNTERKIRIEVGYGLEGAIPDITAQTIIDKEIIPNFREENYYRGLDEATDALIKAAAGEYTAPEGYRDRNDDKGISLGRLIPILIILWIILRIFGGGGRGGGGMMSRRGYRGFRGPVIFPGGGWGSGGGGFGGGGGGGASGSW